MVQQQRRRVPVPPQADELDTLAGEIDVTTVNEEYERTRSEQRGGGDFITLVQGDNLLRLLPPKPGEKVPWVRFFRHKIPGGSGGGGGDKGDFDKFILCPTSILNPDGSKRTCPICKKREPIWAAGEAGDEVAKKNAQALRKQLRIVTEAINLTTDEDAAKGVQLFGYGSMIDEALVGLLTGKFAYNYTSAKAGCPVLITREGKQLQTKYKNIRAITEQKFPLDPEYLRDRVDLQRFVKLPTQDEMRAAMSAMGLLTDGAHVSGGTPVAARMPQQQVQRPAVAQPPAARRPAVARPAPPPPPAPAVDPYAPEGEEEVYYDGELEDLPVD